MKKRALEKAMSKSFHKREATRIIKREFKTLMKASKEYVRPVPVDSDDSSSNSSEDVTDTSSNS